MAGYVNSYSGGASAHGSRGTGGVKPCKSRSMYDIASRGHCYSSVQSIRVPDGLEIVSYDHGILTARSITNGMQYVVFPCGKGGSAMLRRLCVGGSRLERPDELGAAHVIEHADFRALDWREFGGMSKNAATSKSFIEHQSYLLLDPIHGHVQRELQFQRQTMLGSNMQKLQTPDIVREIDNVIDERDFNSQIGGAYRNLVMKGDELLLSRVWGDRANVKPTIGTVETLAHIRTADDLLRLHHAFRGTQRTHVVLAGPVDINRTLALLAHTFNDIPRGDPSVLRALPPSTMPTLAGPVHADISLNSGMRNIAISGLTSAYGPDSDVMSVMVHLVGVLGSQPVVKNRGLDNVAMYFNPESHAGTFSILAKPSQDGDEAMAFANAQRTIEDYIIAPLCHFNDSRVLSMLLAQYRAKLTEATQGGAQESAALIVQGLLACNKPSLAWHINDRFSDHLITPQRVRAVAKQAFNSQQRAVIRCTSRDGAIADSMRGHGPGSVLHRIVDGLGSMVQLAGFRDTPAAPFHPHVTCSHLLPDTNTSNVIPCEYMSAIEDAGVHSFAVKDQRNNVIARCAYNSVRVSPVHKKSLCCSFGSQAEYGGWAQAQLAAEAMNAVSKLAAGGMCKFKLERGELTGTIDRPGQAMPMLWTQPLVSCVALAAASSGAAPGIRGIRQIQSQLPAAALKQAIETATKAYEDPAQAALSQTRSQVCDTHDPGYAPPDLATAKRLLTEQHARVCESLQRLSTCTPRLMGTNMEATELGNTVRQLGMISAEMKRLFSHFRFTPELVQSTLSRAHAPEICIVQHMPGLRTYPFVASASATQPLRREDRAAFLVSNEVMVGGMGSVYTHELRQRGVSYRPAGGVQLGWQNRPVVLLHATFDASQAGEGEALTTANLSSWCRGEKSVFTHEAVEKAKVRILEKLLLSRMDYDAQKYSLWADLDPRKYSASEIQGAIEMVTSDQISTTLPSYFTAQPVINQSWVQANSI